MSLRNRRKNNDESIWSWIFIAVLIMGGAWFVGIPLLLIKLFGSDKSRSERTQAPPLNTHQQNSGPTINNYYNYNTVTRTPAEQRAQNARARRARDSFREFSKSPSANNSRKTSTWLLILGAFLAVIGLPWMVDSIQYYFDFSALLFSMGWVAGGVSMFVSGIKMKKAAARYNRYKAVIGSNPAVNISALAAKLGLSEKLVHKDLQKMVDKGMLGENTYINEELGYLFTSSEADDELQKLRNAAMNKAKQEKAKQEEMGENAYYESLIAQIRDVNDRIAHEVMSEKIYKLENTTREIFRTVQDDSSKRSKIEKFLSYYLPTTLKLLESYAKLEKAGSAGENIQQSKKSIESAMDSIVDGFAHQLDELYKTDVVDIETDIDVMTRMMSRDNAVSEFKVTHEAAADTRTQFEKDFNVSRTSDGSLSYHGSAAPAGQTQTSSGTVSFGGSAAQTK